MLENLFVEEAEKINDSDEILNWYRNLYYTENSNTERGLMARAINDILPEYSRQKALIKALINGQETLQKHIAEKNAEIEVLQLNVEDYAETIVELNANITELVFQKERAKSEAIKEFAERLKNSIRKTILHNGFTLHIQIENLVKELTEFKE